MTAAVDKLMDLADDLVTALATLAETLGTTTGEGENEVLTPAFAAAWQDDPVADLADSTLLAPQVWVVDFAETHQPADLGGQGGVPVCEFELLIILQRKIGEGETPATVCRSMSGLVAEISRYCRRTVVSDAVCFKTERERARDFKVWHEGDLYRAEILTHWRWAGDDSDEGD